MFSKPNGNRTMVGWRRVWWSAAAFLLLQSVTMAFIGLESGVVQMASAEPQRSLGEDLKGLSRSAQKTFLPIAQGLLYNEDLSETCTTALLRTGRALQTGKMWAVKMLTSSGVVPDNLFLGQTQAHGSLEQCLWTNIIPDEDADEEREFHYCKVKLGFDENNTMFRDMTKEIYHTAGLDVKAVPEIVKGLYTGLIISLCLPRECTKADLQVAVDTLTTMYGGWAQVSSCQNADPPAYEPHQIFIIALFCLLGILSIAGTFVDLTQAKKTSSNTVKFFRCFSVPPAWSSLLSHEGSGRRTGFVNGIKLLLCLWIATGHFVIFPSPEYTRNPGEFFSVITRQLWFQIFSNINLAVVGFFFMSGYLVHVNTTSSPSEATWRFIVISFLRRYVKLIVPALVVLLSTLLYPLFIHTATPEEGFYATNVRSCPTEWYFLPCLANNYIDIYREQCLTHMWYIATDLKLYPFILALSIYYRKHPRRSVMLGLLLIVTTSLAVGLETFFGGAAGVVARADLEGEHYFATGKALDLYTKPHTQIAAYIMGMLCAAFIEKVRDNPPNLTLFAQCLMWTLSIGLFLTQTVFITFSSLEVFSPAGIWMSLYAGISRPLHALVYLWILTACSLYYAEPLRRFLSHPVLFILGKLSYGVYLIHFPIGSYGYAHMKNPSLQYDLVILTQNVLGILAQSFVLAVFLYLCVEKPIANLDRLFITHLRRPKKAAEKTGLPSANAVAAVQAQQLPSKDAAAFHTETKANPEETPCPDYSEAQSTEQQPSAVVISSLCKPENGRVAGAARQHSHDKDRL